MRDNWEKYKLGDFLERQYDRITLDETTKYKRLTIRGKGQGIYLRDTVIGFEIGTKNQYIVKENQFLLSKIDAMNGAFGIVPKECNNGIITGNFWTYEIDRGIIKQRYLELLCLNENFTKFSIEASEGTTNRKYLRENLFLNLEILLPSLSEQKRIVAKIESVKGKIEAIQKIRTEQEKEMENLLFSRYTEAIKDVQWITMKKIAPIVRRPVEIDVNESYPELGVRSFGKGTFQKPALAGIDVGTKKLFQIKAGDLIFSNVFAWEGAIAIAQKEDNDRYGSHRFISCAADEKIVLKEFLLYHFLSPKGMEDINACSPGGAGRNKTLGLSKLMGISVPIPVLSKQKEFISLVDKMTLIKQNYEQQETELTELLSGLLDKAFKGEL